MKLLVSPNEMRAIYFLLIRSLFEYCSPVFVHLPVTLEKAGSFPESFTQTYLLYPEGLSCYCCDCNAFPDLTQRRLDAAFRLFLKAASDPCHILHDIIPLRSSRSGRFVQPLSSTSRRRDSFVPYVCALMQKTFIL